MPQALQAGMDCQTFWRSNPRRINQFFEGNEYLESIDLQAWASGYYVALAFAGKMPKKPDLLKKPEEEVSEEQYVNRWLKWAAVQQARLIDKQLKEASANE